MDYRTPVLQLATSSSHKQNKTEILIEKDGFKQVLSSKDYDERITIAETFLGSYKLTVINCKAWITIKTN